MALRDAALEHPLPAGMRDLLPPETRARRRIAEVFLRRTELEGYEEVVLPAVEYAATMERGLGTLDAGEMVRFVESETGEVVALRPDVTPQIARVAATRLGGRPTPYRLVYHASVLRRRSGSRARTHRQIPQLGIERIDALPRGDAPPGMTSPLPGADIEPIRLALEVVTELGLGNCTVDLGHAEVVRALLGPLPPEVRANVADALGHKDEAELTRATAALPADLRAAIGLLPRLHGDVQHVFAEVPRGLREGPAGAAIAALESHCRLLAQAVAHLPLTLRVDLGEVRGFAYYTGPFGQILAPGPGVPIGSGGRYDELISRFGRPLAATGFALDVDALTWALRASSARVLGRAVRVVLGADDLGELRTRLHACGIPALVQQDDAEAYARAWDFTHLVVKSGAELLLRDLTSGDTVKLVGSDDCVAKLSTARAASTGTPACLPAEEH